MYVDFICNVLKHRGEILEKVVRASGYSLAHVAKMMGYDRSSLYKHFENDEVSFSVLAHYGRVLGHDFRHEFPEMESYNSQLRDPLILNQPRDMAEALLEINRWRDKYIDLLEKHNTLLEDRNKQLGELMEKTEFMEPQ